jgi:hypothetical protein
MQELGENQKKKREEQRALCFSIKLVMKTKHPLAGWRNNCVLYIMCPPITL